MAAMSNDLVRERIAVCKAKSGLGCRKVCVANPFDILNAQLACYNLLSPIIGCPWPSKDDGRDVEISTHHTHKKGTKHMF